MRSLKERFDIPGLVSIGSGRGNLTRIVVTSPLAEAEVYVHGAHVMHFRPAGQQPVLWLSKSSWFEPNKPIRGGVPICFPWFGAREGDAKAPAHGFARLREWEIESIIQSGNAVVVTLVLKSDDLTRAWWPFDFIARHIITLGSALEMTLEVHNETGQPIRFQEALHTYLSVGDIRSTTIQGLGSGKYLDKVGGASEYTQTDRLIHFTGQTDRIYLDTRATCIVDDAARKRKIEISKSGSNETVVWNPWIEKAKAMPDFGDDEWPGMLCVETANVARHTVELASGAAHAMTARIRIV